ncbi:MAG TPA: MarR family transcriptional regulator [Gemmatimonadales bacterium]|nr:MarR family transcriptional regulator [Gemmatimonadales bacterium]
MAIRRPPTVAEEIHQSRPFASAGSEAAVTLRRTVAVLDRHYAPLFDAEELSASQYNVLRILRGAGSGGLPTLAIRDRLVDLSPGITRLIDRLEEAGLVVRDRGDEDRRQVLCRITPAGTALLGKMERAVDQADRAVVAALTPTEQRTLVRLLDQVRAGLRAGAGLPSPSTRTDR